MNLTLTVTIYKIMERVDVARYGECASLNSIPGVSILPSRRREISEDTDAIDTPGKVRIVKRALANSPYLDQREFSPMIFTKPLTGFPIYVRFYSAFYDILPSPLTVRVHLVMVRYHRKPSSLEK